MTTSPPDVSQLRIRRDDPSPAQRGRGGLIAAIVAGAVVAGAALWFFLAPRPTEVRVAAATATGGGSLSGSGITANGYVVARTKASVSAEVAGRMEYLGVQEGSHVRKGEIIARIEGGDFAAQLDAARAAVTEAEAQRVQGQRDLERAQRLRNENMISDAELENAGTRVNVLEAQLRSARARRQLAEVNFENTRVRAPFDGTVLRKDAEVGEIVAPASAGGGLTRTAIVTMADLATLEVEVDVNEAYIAQIANAQPARITLDAYPDTSFAGQVRQVVPTADRQKATVQVKVSILDRDPRILPEMGAKVTFERGTSATAVAVPSRVLVPAAAIVRSSEGTRVWVVANGKASSRSVDVGPTRDDQIEVRSGLEGGENVILTPPANLKEGGKVRVASS